jgi:tetratricopeptide (TPR) repeat protein
MWSEINTGHFTVWSSADDGSARTLAWQFEQIRSVVKTMWPWAQVDLTKPMLIFVVKDEAAMKTMVPEFWERRGATHPASVWVTGRDRHYMVIRADVRGQDTDVLNPHTTAYYGYTNLVLEESFDHELPLWFSRGLSGVLSNTIIHDTTVKVGPPIPWHLAALRAERRFHLARLLKVDRKSPEYLQGGQLETFDAEAWAFVHMLMFGNDGAYRPKLDTFMRMMRAGKEPEAAFAETFGDPAQYEMPFVTYITRAIYSYARGETDSAVKREKFALRPLGVAESAAGRAAFQVAMGREAEARALIAAGRQADPNEPGTYVAEGLLFDRAGDPDQAQAAFARAVTLDSKDFYAHYRLGSLLWRSPVSGTALREIEAHYSHAIALNTRSADAYSAVAEARSAQGRPEEDTVPFVLRAVSLEPAAAYHHVVAAKVYLRANKLDEAEREVRKAQSLPDVDRVQGLVDTLIADIARARGSRRP